MKFCGVVGLGPGKNWLDIGGDPDLDPDSAFFFTLLNTVNKGSKPFRLGGDMHSKEYSLVYYSGNRLVVIMYMHVYNIQLHFAILHV